MNPLSGIKVIEIGQVLAGPFAGAIFADLGAEVIKVERPGSGDDARLMGRAFRHGDSMAFQVFNRGKRSVTIDLKDGKISVRGQGPAPKADVHPCDLLDLS